MRVMLCLLFAAVLGACSTQGSRQQDESVGADNHDSAASGKGLTLKGFTCQRRSGYHLYYVDMVCPIGGEAFKVLRLGAHSTYGKYLDFEPESYMHFPAPMPICPSNGMVIDEDEYSDERLAEISRVIAEPSYQDILVGNTSYYVYAQFLERLGDPDVDLWWISLVATWEAGQCNSGLYEEYARTALQYAEDEFAKTEPDDENFFALGLTISNLHRRLGEFDMAEQKLSVFLERKGFDPDKRQVEILDHLGVEISNKNPNQSGMDVKTIEIKL